jgi:hypothetical protein
LNFQAKRASSQLQVLGLSIGSRAVWIEEHSDHRDPRQQIVQQPKLFGTQLAKKKIHTGNIAARAIHARHEADLNRIIAARENDGDR